ncbi:MAG: hypothetical protein R3B82_07170 [Sandaracinaceae bacterium]
MPGQARGGIHFVEPLIFERGAPGRHGSSIPALDVPAADPKALFGASFREEPPSLPEVSEPEAFRHYVRLSQANFSIDSNMYPLGSCTMKYNPKVDEHVARFGGFAHIHPYAPERMIQGALELMYRLERGLAEVCGLDRVTLQPAAGAQGELTGLMMIARAGGAGPEQVLVPRAAHGLTPRAAPAASRPCPSRWRGRDRLGQETASTTTSPRPCSPTRTVGLFWAVPDDRADAPTKARSTATAQT